MIPAVRTAEPGELPALAEVERAADGVFAPLGIVFPPGTVVEEVTDTTSVLVAGCPPVAFACTGELDGRSHLHQIAVHPAHARRGIGTALMAAVIDRAGERGMGVTLTTFRDVAWNAPWYARLGFVVVQRPSSGLAAVVAAERAAGLHDLGPRVAMYRPHVSGPVGSGR